MALTLATIKASLAWAMEKANTGFASTTQTDSKAYTLAPTVATFNQLYAARLTIAAGANSTVDLQSFTSLDGTAVTLTKVIGMLLLPTGTNAICKVEPGATNPLTWFFSGTTPAVSIPTGGCFLFAQATAATVSASAKTIKFSNTGSGSMTLDIVILGGT